MTLPGKHVCQIEQQLPFGCLQKLTIDSKKGMQCKKVMKYRDFVFIKVDKV